MKKYFIVFAVIIIFIVFLYSRKMTNPGMLPPGATYTLSKCNGYYLDRNNPMLMDGPQHGYCFGYISKTVITP